MGTINTNSYPPAGLPQGPSKKRSNKSHKSSGPNGGEPGIYNVPAGFNQVPVMPMEVPKTKPSNKPSIFKEFFMKFEWDKFFDASMTISGILVAGAVLIFLLMTMKSCQAQSFADDQVKLNAKHKALQECIDKTQKVWECKQSILP